MWININITINMITLTLQKNKKLHHSLPSLNILFWCVSLLNCLAYSNNLINKQSPASTATQIKINGKKKTTPDHGLMY